MTRNLAGQYGVDGVAQRVKHRRVGGGYATVQGKDVLGRDSYVFGEAAVAVDAENFKLLAKMLLADSALQAVAAGDVHFGAYELSESDIVDLTADLLHGAAKL